MVHYWRVFHRWLPGDPFSEGKPPVIFIVHFVPIILFLHRRRFKRGMTGFKIGYFWISRILRRKKNLFFTYEGEKTTLEWPKLVFETIFLTNWGYNCIKSGHSFEHRKYHFRE